MHSRKSVTIYIYIITYIYGGRSSVVSEPEFKSEDPGFDPLVGQRKGQFLLPLRVNSCADLFVSDLPSCVRHALKLLRTLKIPYPSVVKE